MLARVGPSAQRVDRAGVVVELLAGGVVVERFAELVVSWAGVVLPMSASSTPGGNALQPRLVAAAAALGLLAVPTLTALGLVVASAALELVAAATALGLAVELGLVATAGAGVSRSRAARSISPAVGGRVAAWGALGASRRRGMSAQTAL